MQRIDLAWLHARLGVHPHNDPAMIVYEDTQNMSVDIYTKAFSSPASWNHAPSLINIFDDSWFKSVDNITHWMGLREQLGHEVVFDDSAMRAQWPKGTRTQNAKANSQVACACAAPGQPPPEYDLSVS